MVTCSNAAAEKCGDVPSAVDVGTGCNPTDKYKNNGKTNAWVLDCGGLLAVDDQLLPPYPVDAPGVWIPISLPVTLTKKITGLKDFTVTVGTWDDDKKQFTNQWCFCGDDALVQSAERTESTMAGVTYTDPATTTNTEVPAQVDWIGLQVPRIPATFPWDPSGNFTLTFGVKVPAGPATQTSFVRATAHATDDDSAPLLDVLVVLDPASTFNCKKGEVLRVGEDNMATDECCTPDPVDNVAACGTDSCGRTVYNNVCMTQYTGRYACIDNACACCGTKPPGATDDDPPYCGDNQAKTCGLTCGSTCEDGQVCCPNKSDCGDCMPFTCCEKRCDSGTQCGRDHCCGSCGDCKEDEVCQPGGTCCASTCYADDKKVRNCGPDGCGGNCGTCDAGAGCYNGVCCKPDCANKTCGDDGCGGSCGNCGHDQVCRKANDAPPGTCCTRSCSEHGVAVKTCGDDGCGGVCGVCKEKVEVCLRENCCKLLCYNTKGEQVRDCGDDGCGSTCGSCTGKETCHAGKCCAASCPDPPLNMEDPSGEGQPCGDDGCGGSCGVCMLGMRCLNQHCHTPQCKDRACGDDGFGASCGTCEDPLKPHCDETTGTCGQYCLTDANCVQGNVCSPTSVCSCGGGIPCSGGYVCVNNEYCCVPSCTSCSGEDGCGGSCADTCSAAPLSDWAIALIVVACAAVVAGVIAGAVVGVRKRRSSRV